jgi:hypothetical protein
MTATLVFSGRIPIAWWWKIQPWWWFYNSTEPVPPSWYTASSIRWLDTFLWYCRNPLVNFKWYVVGVADRNYTVYGQAPVNVTDWNDVGQTGWKTSVIHLGLLRLPYVSYTGASVVWHVGWEPNGNLAFKWNRRT